MSKAKVIALYLPQYHPTADNDKWWGKGFTEWTNVAKAKPLFRGHYQPHIPADLGFYDLRLPETREAQAELAKEAGIDGFCYYHYWFGNGKMELERPFQEVIRLGKPDFPFMLCWANESWHKKFWNKDGKGTSKEILVEQTFPGEEDIINHFNYLLPAFKDPRYLKEDGKPLFMIYKPYLYPDVANFINIWNRLAQENGFPGIHFIGCLLCDINKENITKMYSLGFNAVNTFGMWDFLSKRYNIFDRIIRKFNSVVFKKPRTANMSEISKNLFSEFDREENVYPTIIPNWDHTPRSGSNGLVAVKSSPKIFEDQIKECLEIIKNKDKQIVFLKSWNEWGEGNYVEPDMKYGKQYIDVLKNTIK